MSVNMRKAKMWQRAIKSKSGPLYLSWLKSCLRSLGRQKMYYTREIARIEQELLEEEAKND